MKNTKFEIGLKNLQTIDGTAGEKVINNLESIAPHVGQHIIEFAFGEIYESDVLNLREREIVTVACLLTQGDTKNQLIVHINGCLNVGLSQEEIIEVFTQCIPYVGFPKVLNAIYTAQEVFS
ncbi:carboxymuconolactone decarboxylase family protein [Enterococcus faecalis]|uniref:carboxymuconolactone decarboxylase family protein n=1 Tax=Enterococcus faecalis TaxID=1351 RepID=UPI00287118D3|nr:carboxymuconolactone decarboxylase family protein [Enterococcus faecalis]EJG4482949.1 carboxymuconolactone decarboxylase family protein [Enterococcus faecalis]EKL7559185.1 carboxymuconolactone decarboxylase family protein [Enterococcus faecalis]MDR9788639.1 carboxymuconolactone decarboxylase family protein [Enterococcus faecalis]HBI1614256.1 carboxymuconolactone decarboxylase family protein [Enterococcus faecalis]